MSRLTLKLWAGIMIFIFIMLGLLWIIQVVFLQRYYNSLVFNEITTKFTQMCKDADNRQELEDILYPYVYENFSNINAFIFSKKDLAGVGISLIQDYGVETAGYILSGAQNALNGKPFREFVRIVNSTEKAWLIILPIEFPQSEPCAAFIIQRISSVTSIQNLLKNQLATLSIVLVGASFILSLFLARIFTKPILAINKTVDRIAEGDLEASANVTQKDELGELSHSVDNLAKSLKKVDILRKELIANVSHELKSPLSLIRGYAELVREISWKNDKDRNDNLNLIIDESQRMSVMVNDILDYSLIQSGYLTLKTEILPLDTIISDAALESSKQGEKFSLSIEVNNKTPNVNVCVDNIKIHQVFRNLLNNAINHSHDGEKIKINSFFLNGDIRIEICNKGNPIPAEERSLIWERYHRAQHQGGRKQGTGLGLSIVKTICDAHNMTYGTDYIDGNNVFWFQIPMKRVIIEDMLL